MSEKVSSKTLCRLTFQEASELREIVDGTHNPYVYAKWIPEKDVEGLVTVLQTLRDEYDEKKTEHPPKTEYVKGLWHGVNIAVTKISLLLDFKEQKKEKK